MDSLLATFVLWDVDHTLIENGGVSKETYAAAFELIAQRKATVQPVTHGRTDFQIMRELLEANDVDASGYSSISQFEDVLLSAMRVKAPELPSRGYALPGVVEALKTLADMPNVTQSALTGNIAQNAYSKVAAFGLDEWLDLEVGGFGSDDEVRSNLVGAAQRKAFAKYGVQFDRDSTILIGDTPLDVKAAHDGGAKVIAVATGVHGVDELRACRADAVLPDLADTKEFLATLERVRG